MEERKICSGSTPKNIVKIIIAMLTLIIAIILFVSYRPEYNKAREDIQLYWRAYRANESLLKTNNPMGDKNFEKENADWYEDMHARLDDAKVHLYASYGLAGVAILLLASWLYSGRAELIVTDKRVYGKAAFGKAVDLPISSIVMINKSGKKSIAISTSAGKVKFVAIKNRDEVYGTLQTLITVK